MAISTERTVRTTIVTAIRAIAQTSLGFDAPGGNVWEGPLERELLERRVAYLTASVGQKRAVRAWAVDVLGYDEFFGMKSLMKRTYQIAITGYYGNDGDRGMTLVDHATKVRGAMRDLTVNIGGTVSLVSGSTGLSIAENNSTDAGPMFVGTLRYTAIRENPDF